MTQNTGILMYKLSMIITMEIVAENTYVHVHLLSFVSRTKPKTSSKAY